MRGYVREADGHGNGGDFGTHVAWGQRGGGERGGVREDVRGFVKGCVRGCVRVRFKESR